MARRVVSHEDFSGLILDEKDQVAPEGDLVGFEPHPDARRLQRSSSRMVDGRVIPEEAHVGHVAPGLHSRRNRVHNPQGSDSCEPVQIGGPGGLQGRAASKLIERIVSHPVADKNNEFFIHLNQPAVSDI